MSKVLGFIFFIFFSLVALTWLFNMAGAVLSPIAATLPSTAYGSEVFGAAGSSNSPLNFNLFSKDGSGASYMTQGYGRTSYSYLYPNDWHDGIDIAASYGEAIYSPNDGTIIATGNQDNYCYHKGFGKYVAVRDPKNNLVLWYAHLGTIAVSPGQTISRGEELGTIGSTGLETGSHLHFSIFAASGFAMQVRDGCGPEPTGQDLDPLNYLGTTYNKL